MNLHKKTAFRKKLCFSLALTALALINVTPAHAQTPNISPECSYILMDSKTGQVILEQNADVKLRPASTTKTMTAIVALENGQLNDPMKVSEKAVNDIGAGGMNVGIMPGEDNLTLENLLNVMLIKSANETANIIAENVCESREKFIEKMNDKALELGAVNTHFVNPCGKDDAKEDSNHLSTARDMAIIARYAMTLPKFREIVGKEYYNGMPATNKHAKWDALRTSNKLLWDTNNYPYSLEGAKHNYIVNGIKTGYTNAAGNNLIASAVDENGMELIAVVMHVTEGNNKVFSYTKELLRYGFEHFSNQRVVEVNQTVKSVSVEGAKGDAALNLVTASEITCALPLDKGSWNIATRENINQLVKAPVKQGDVLGTVQYERNGVVLGKTDLIASRTVPQDEKGIALNAAGNKFPVNQIIIFLSVLAGFACLRITLRQISISRKRKKRRKLLSSIQKFDIK